MNIISNIISWNRFAETYAVVSLILIILTVFGTIAYFYPNFGFFHRNIDAFDLLNKFLFFTLFVQFVLSTFALIDQTQRIDITIYPPKCLINDFGEYYGIRYLKEDDEDENIQVFFLKRGSSKIILNNVKPNFPDYGELLLVSTSFVSAHRNSTDSLVRGKEEIKNDQIIDINKNINDFAAYVYQFRIYDKKYYKLTSETFTITISYTIFLFGLKLFNKTKSETIKIGY